MLLKISEYFAGNLEILRQIMQVSKELLTSMRTATDGKHYRKLLEKGIAEIEELQQYEDTHNQVWWMLDPWKQNRIRFRFTFVGIFG